MFIPSSLKMGVLSTHDIELCASIDMNQLDYLSYLCVNINDYVSEFREFLRRHVIIQTEEGVPILGELSDAYAELGARRKKLV